MPVLLLLISLFICPVIKAERIVLAGGCFWCMEPPFEKLEGVNTVTSGYAGGSTVNPNYKQVSSGSTGHTEVIEVDFDPKKISLNKILDTYWLQVDPTRDDGQFCDKGKQYRPAIFYTSKTQKTAIEASKLKATKKIKIKKNFAVEVAPLKDFYKAEEYHQDYYKKNPLRYKYYRYRCGRDQRLEELWGKSKP